FALIAGAFGLNFGIGNLILAHTVFCIPFAYMPIRARLEDMDLTLEYAAADLYATPWNAFKRITLPLLVPGIMSGAALAFIVSFDDFTITQLVAGPGQTTLPLYIWNQIR
ncbi:ABC transporter permease subunit, partial [Mesorhizobium sp. M2E.F.Ca.ET.154.01.1.1]